MTGEPPTDRGGDWIQTFSGRCFWPLDPRADEIEMVDIAHALSMKCRYGGHCMRFYSVAEHSVLVSQHVPPEFALWGLLHDAGEAYLADIPRPVKPFIPNWKAIEARVMAAVCERFGLDPTEPTEVKAVGLAITADERAALLGPCDRRWGELPPPIGALIAGLPPYQARQAFIRRFHQLMPTAKAGMGE